MYNLDEPKKLTIFTKNILSLLLLLFQLQNVFPTCTNMAYSLNILFVVSSFPVISETFILHQITDLLDKNCNVFIYSLNQGNFTIVHDSYYKYNLRARTFYAEEKKSLKKIKALSFDILLCHFGPMGYVGHELIKKLNLKAKLCTFFHGYDVSILPNINPEFYANLFPILDLALPISSFWKNRLIEIGCNPRKIIVHHMGINCDTLKFQQRILDSNKKIRLLSIARLVEKKGIVYALQAFAQVAQLYDNIEYYIVGDGILKRSLQNTIQELNLQAKVTLLGWQPQKRVIELLYDSHILVAPSITASDNDQEGIPVSIMEAMATGMPVISTYHSGIPELIDDEITGLLVPEKSINELAQKIITLIKHPETWQKMGHTGRKKIEHFFEIHALNEQLLNIFYTMIIKK